MKEIMTRAHVIARAMKENRMYATYAECLKHALKIMWKIIRIEDADCTIVTKSTIISDTNGGLVEFATYHFLWAYVKEKEIIYEGENGVKIRVDVLRKPHIEMMYNEKKNTYSFLYELSKIPNAKVFELDEKVTKYLKSHWYCKAYKRNGKVRFTMDTDVSTLYTLDEIIRILRRRFDIVYRV